MKINVSVEKDGKKIITKGIHIDETKIDVSLNKAIGIGMDHLNKTVMTELGLEVSAPVVPVPTPTPVAPPVAPTQPTPAQQVIDDKLYTIVKEKVAQEIKRVEDAKIAAAQPPVTPPQAPPVAAPATPPPVTPPTEITPPAAPKAAPAAPQPTGDAK